MRRQGPELFLFSDLLAFFAGRHARGFPGLSRLVGPIVTQAVLVGRPGGWQQPPRMMRYGAQDRRAATSAQYLAQQLCVRSQIYPPPPLDAASFNCPKQIVSCRVVLSD